MNTLDDELSRYFDVSPPTNVSSGDLPVVEDVFQLQIIEEDGDTQLSVRWMSGNERKVETILCGGCKTIELNGKLVGLVGKLFGGKKKVEPVVVVENGKIVVLFLRKENGEKGWFWDGDDKNDTKYVGEIEKGRPHGMGTITFGKGTSEGQKYIGEWKDGKYHGQGTYTFPDGKKYVGKWGDGLKNGQGTFTWNDGGKYIGEYKDGKYDGQGTYTWSDGRKYVGEYKDGKKNGQGTKTWTNGDMYEGEFKDGKYHGQGTYTWSDGRKYVGEWKDGETKRSWYCHFTGWEVCGGMEGE